MGAYLSERKKILRQKSNYERQNFTISIQIICITIRTKAILEPTVHYCSKLCIINVINL